MLVFLFALIETFRYSVSGYKLTIYKEGKRYYHFRGGYHCVLTSIQFRRPDCNEKRTVNGSLISVYTVFRRYIFFKEIFWKLETGNSVNEWNKEIEYFKKRKPYDDTYLIYKQKNTPPKEE